MNITQDINFTGKMEFEFSCECGMKITNIIWDDFYKDFVCEKCGKKYIADLKIEEQSK